jgi:hypothetical protein
MFGSVWDKVKEERHFSADSPPILTVEGALL